jgi:glycogen synthase
VVTGRGEPELEEALREAQRRRPDSIEAAIRFEGGEAKRIFAASDFTLMPSRFEPCRLSQMYAQRFGSLPIGHQTGGLSDTILDGETGFLFSKPSTESLLGGICRAFAIFGQTERLNEMRARESDLCLGEVCRFVRDAVRKIGGGVAFSSIHRTRLSSDRWHSSAPANSACGHRYPSDRPPGPH